MVFQRLFWFFIAACVIYQAPIWAATVKVEVIQPQAFFTPSQGSLYKPLDHKRKTFMFSATDFENCGKTMARKVDTMMYFCSIDLPESTPSTKLRQILSAQSFKVRFGGTEKQVSVRVAPDVSKITLTTAFDNTGVDFDMVPFNQDFYKVYSKVAQLIFSEALQINSLQVETLEEPKEKSNVAGSNQYFNPNL